MGSCIQGSYFYEICHIYEKENESLNTCFSKSGGIM